jgi:hypothetical protein
MKDGFKSFKTRLNSRISSGGPVLFSDTSCEDPFSSGKGSSKDKRHSNSSSKSASSKFSKFSDEEEDLTY